MPLASPVIPNRSDSHTGSLVFPGTRVPLRTLLSYLEAGDSLTVFLEDFPSVTREQAVGVLRLAEQMLLERARAV